MSVFIVTSAEYVERPEGANVMLKTTLEPGEITESGIVAVKLPVGTISTSLAPDRTTSPMPVFRIVKKSALEPFVGVSRNVIVLPSNTSKVS